MNINSLLEKYKHLVDFEDKMQKSNYKFVEKYLKFQMRKNRNGWEQDCIEFLVDAVDLQENFLLNIKKWSVDKSK